MNYFLSRVKHCTPTSIGELIKRTKVRITLVFAMENEGAAAFLALDTPDPATALRAAGIQVAKPESVQLPRPAAYLTRVQERTRGMRFFQPSPFPAPGVGKQLRLPTPPASRSRGGRYHLRAMTESFALEEAVRAMRPGEYFLVSLNPKERCVASRTLDEDTNQRFSAERVFAYIISGSSPAMGQALAQDLSGSFGDFRCSANPGISEGSRFHANMMTASEALLLGDALGLLLGNVFTPGIDAYMKPGTRQSFGLPDVAIGLVNGRPVGLAHKHLLQNVAILGATGSGKSELLISAVSQLSAAGIPCLIVAPVKRDFSSAFSSSEGVCLYRAGSASHPLRMNLLGLPHTQKSARLAGATLAEVVAMGGDDSALPMLYENALQGLYASSNEPVTLPALARAVKMELLNSAYKQETAHSLAQAATNRLKSLAGTPEFNCATGSIDLDRVFAPGQITIFELNDMEAELRRAFATIFLIRLREKYFAMSNVGREKPRLVILLDELHVLLRERQTPGKDPFRDVLNNSLNESGGQAVGYIFADQRLDLIGELAEYGCSNHILMRGLATEQAANVLRLPADDPMLSHLALLRPGESLLHVSGEATIAVGAAPLKPRQNNSEPAPVPIPCPYPACEKTCATCNPEIQAIANEAVLSNLYGAAYNDYLHAGSLYERSMEAWKRQRKEHRNNPGNVPESPLPASRQEVVLQTKMNLIAACLQSAVEKAREKGLDPREIGMPLRHCTEQTLAHQLNFRVTT